MKLSRHPSLNPPAPSPNSPSTSPKPSFFARIGDSFRSFGRHISAFFRKFRSDFEFIYGKNRYKNRSLLKAYVGKNFDKISTKTFSVPGFFLTSLYLFYRKMRWTGLLVFALQLGLILITKNLIINSLKPNIWVDLTHQLLISLLVGFLVNKFYLWDAEHKIAILKLKFPGASLSELKGICMARGRTSFAIAVPGLFIEILISAVVAIAAFISHLITNLPIAIQSAQHEVQSVIESGLDLIRPWKK